MVREAFALEITHKVSHPIQHGDLVPIEPSAYLLDVAVLVLFTSIVIRPW